MRKAKEILGHYFFPHQSNNYKAKSLHHHALIYYLILLFLFQTFSQVLKNWQPSILGYATDITIEKIVSFTNQERIKNELPPLRLSAELSTAATQKAADMFTKDYWAHISPTGVSPWTFIKATGYDYLYAGENLAKDFNASEEIVSAWMNSPTHRANILKPEYTDLGISVMNGRLNGQETTLVVQQFGAKIGSPGDSSLPETVATTGLVSSTQEAKKFSFPFPSSKTASLILAEFLLFVLFIDSLFIWRHKTVRISGHSLAHAIFLASLIGAMGATGVGVIL